MLCNLFTITFMMIKKKEEERPCRKMNPVKLRIVELASKGTKRVGVSMPNAQGKTVHEERNGVYKGSNGTSRDEQQISE